MNREQARFYLAGIIDGEGHVSFCKTKQGHMARSITIANTDWAIMEAVIECCNLLEYDYSLCKRKRQRVEWKPCWSLKVTGTDNLQRIADEIPMRASGKLETLRAALKSVKRLQLSSRQRRMVDALLSEGVKTREIAAVIGCDQRTIQYRKQKLARTSEGS